MVVTTEFLNEKWRAASGQIYGGHHFDLKLKMFYSKNLPPFGGAILRDFSPLTGSTGLGVPTDGAG